MEVPPPMVSGSEPEFVDEEWLSKRVEDILSLYRTSDTMAFRLPPTAFVRCSRGGKTRALKEIAKRLKSIVHASVIFVSFNESSDISSWEQVDPLGALCRRIAFAARRNRKANYDSDFAKADVKPEQIVEWLGRDPRILLVDEMNNCNSLLEKSIPSTNLAEFLKKNFLSKEDQYLVFSSHIVSTVGQLSSYMDSGSSRPIAIHELPLIRNVTNAIKIFRWPELNAGKALFYGLVPALIHIARLEELRKTQHLSFQKVEEAIDVCVKDGLVTDKSVRYLLANFVDGEKRKVMKPLHQFMNTAEEEKLRWIPIYMTKVLDSLEFSAPSLDENIRVALRRIVKLFNEFTTVEKLSGKAWESLFLLVVIIRVVSGKFDEVILPLMNNLSMDYSISFNQFIDTDQKVLEDIVDVDEIVGCFTEPDRYPHVAIYQPTNASFPLFDLIIAVYGKTGSRKLYAYQLKEGKEIPKHNTSLVMTEFEVCVLVRGQPSQGETRSKEQWIIPSKSEIAAFFGESGKHWTPEEWNKLMIGQTFEKGEEP
mmetsp:Transcript_22762/g.32681  ORF Transcript_22762/g.32681 Transcript_22762/m.32681 type:complete len:537 (+) Transcript_22762:613-2223(+)